MTVKPLINGAELKKVTANTVKFLARTYLYNINEIVVDKMPQRILSELDYQSSGSQPSDKKIILVQTIYSKTPAPPAEPTGDSKEAPSDVEGLLSEGNSAYRLHALISKQDGVGFSMIPVTFKTIAQL